MLPSHALRSISGIPLISSTVDLVPTVTNLRVVFDGQLTMAPHTASICRSGFFQLCQLKSIRRSLTTEVTRVLLQAFMYSLGYPSVKIVILACVILTQWQCVMDRRTDRWTTRP